MRHLNGITTTSDFPSIDRLVTESSVVKIIDWENLSTLSSKKGLVLARLYS